MKKTTDSLSPSIPLILGALLFVYYLNFLSYSGTWLALGICGIVVSVCYLGLGALSAATGISLSASARKKVGLLAVCLFPVFMFVDFLLVTIAASNFMGPTAWTIKILSMVVSLAFAATCVLSELDRRAVIFRCKHFCALAFVLVLLMDLLFDISGGSNALGDIDILPTVIYGAYTFYLFRSVIKTEDAPESEDKKQ